ncbi:MAG: hypothetical protein ONB16_03835 [candidate division KSB1 bacterium]|nr:hypothetical protein [candidate division KSB1 bacterium]MDZ7318040.1 hypothetical protein [candidate division KSB1 bacterium]MDZ7341320.1 hypothetical protein [candidate division KSB1 bacterium]
MSHELAEKTAGLASRINNLAVLHSGKHSRQLLELQDQLARLTLLAIVRELNAEHEAYQAAMAGIHQAIDLIGEADKKIKKITEVINVVAQTINAIEQALMDAAL